MTNKNSISHRGTQVKTGDKFGLAGWWVNTDLSSKINPIRVEYPEDEVAGKTQRFVFVYFGEIKPTKEQMKNLIDSTPIIYKSVKY